MDNSKSLLLPVENHMDNICKGQMKVNNEQWPCNDPFAVRWFTIHLDKYLVQYVYTRTHHEHRSDSFNLPNRERGLSSFFVGFCCGPSSFINTMYNKYVLYVERPNHVQFSIVNVSYSGYVKRFPSCLVDIRELRYKEVNQWASGSALCSLCAFLFSEQII